ncbi:MAG: quinate/shikimate dehydrogenase [Eubacterium sp.]|nr:quinate/shikimate dehydrogenase [Eubacterium sp.]
MRENTEITATTKGLCVIGSPISHSISPAMHNEAIKALGIDYVYTAFDIPEDKIEMAIRSLKILGFAGCNVTMPGKLVAAKIADERTPMVELCEAANTITFRDGKICADSTDGVGFMLTARRHGADPVGKRLVVLGAGGAAKAVIAQAALDGVAQIDIFRRAGEAFRGTEEFADRVMAASDCRIRVIDLADEQALRESLAGACALVNGTSVGMEPHPEGCLIPDASFLHEGLFVCDLVYHPVMTRLLTMAKESGCEIATGKSVLLFQGAASFEQFTGHKMPVDRVIDVVFDGEV